MLKIYEVESYKEYGKCLTISNEKIEAIFTLNIGPRIVSFKFIGDENVLLDDRSAFAPMGGIEFDNHYYKGAAWESLGGHRLWIAPESLPETYNPDMKPVDYSVNNNIVTFIQAPQAENGVQISFKVTMDEDKPEMLVEHFGKNITNDNKEFALWPITVMAKNGIEIIPLNTNDTGLLPNRNLTFWPYSKLNDPRLNVLERYITIKQDPSNTDAFKIGVDCNKGVGYYVLNNTVFSKEYNHNVYGNYPDFSASYESYTNETILEFESLSPLYTVAPNETIKHTEKFVLYKKPAKFDFSTDENIDEFIKNLTSEK